MYNRLVTDYLDQTAAKYPDKVAFADVNHSITWSGLQRTAKRWAQVIDEAFPPRSAVPVMMNKSVETITMFFAVIYSGRFYSYFENTFPQSRILSMLDTLGANTIISEKRFCKKLDGFTSPVKYLCYEDFDTSPVSSEETMEKRSREAIDTDLIYANFTSGSTGTPKAVVVNHRSVVDFITVFADIFHITQDDRLANQAPFDFDVSVKDIFTAAFTGAEVHLVPKAYFSMPAKLLDFLVERKITSICWAVSAVCIISTLKGFDYKVPLDIKRVMFSGEVMPPKQLAIWKAHLPSAVYINLYGPTEITCNCTYHVITDKDDPQLPPAMGIPFPNERVFLLDDDDKEIESPGISGEVCVSGTCVADGYYNSTKTAEVFVQNPLQSERIERVYRTGDMAHYGDDGLFYYDGRRDTQIKHMGHRIELGEIETQLQKADGVERAVCIFSNNKITAFYVAACDIENAAFVSCIKRDLPAFMVPSAFVRIECLPLTKNGKADRKALAASLEEKNA